MLKIALQKSGRLTEPSFKLLSECGIEFEKSNGQLKIQAHNFPIEVLLLRDDDIPKCLSEEIVDAAIVGENTLIESDIPTNFKLGLGFGRCRLSLAIKREEEYKDLNYFNGKKIATSYPKILGSFLETNQIKSQIQILSGAVEISPGIGISDAICDLVSSGSTLLSNGLKEVAAVLSSQAILTSNLEIKTSSIKHDIFDKLLVRIKAVLQSRHLKYITLNLPNEKINQVLGILPGLKSPSILPLATSGWSSMHTVINEDNFWEIIDQLKSCGAEGILVLPIEKLIA